MKRNLLLVAGMVLAAASQAQFTIVPLQFQNERIQNQAGSASLLPEGPVTLAGVDFDIQNVGGNNVYAMYGVGTQVYTLPTSVANTSKVHLILGTLWGSTTPDLARIDFKLDGTTYTKMLTGGVDMRDYLFGNYTNTINGTTTVNGVTVGDGFQNETRLDVFTYDFGTSGTLEEIQITDFGGNGTQRVFVAGITAEAVPEPFSMVAFGLAGAAFLRRRKQQ